MDGLHSRFEALAASITVIADALDRLSREAEDLGGEYVRAFPALCRETEILEGRLHALTHETAMEVGFSLDDLRRMERFIRFRAAYPQFDGVDFAAVLGGDSVPLAVRKTIASRFPDAREGPRLIEQVRKEWNAAFGNRACASVLDLFSRPKTA